MKGPVHSYDIRDVQPHYEQIVIKLKGDRTPYYLSYDELKKIFNMYGMIFKVTKKRTRRWLETGR